MYQFPLDNESLKHYLLYLKVLTVVAVVTITNFCAQIGNVFRSNGHATEKTTAATKVTNQLIFVKVS